MARQKNGGLFVFLFFLNYLYYLEYLQKAKKQYFYSFIAF